MTGKLPIPSLDHSHTNLFDRIHLRKNVGIPSFFFFFFLQSITKFLRDDSSVPEYVEMRKMLFNPYKLYMCGGVGSVIRGAMNTSAGKSDAFFTPEVSIRYVIRTKRIYRRSSDNSPVTSLFFCVIQSFTRLPAG